MYDVTAPRSVQIEVQERGDNTVVYVHVDGITFFRACNVKHLTVVHPKGSYESGTSEDQS